MKQNFFTMLLSILTIALVCCNGQIKTNTQNNIPVQTGRLVGGGCDGCELMYEGMPDNIHSTDTSAGWNERGQKLLVTGTVYQLGGKIPAPNVIIYYWQTDNNGLYSSGGNINAKAERHGHIRGWMKTDEYGKYSLYTIRPASYPNSDIPAHIHISIKEPNIDNEYYIDDFVFDDDKLLIGDKRSSLEYRGGSGALRVVVSEDLHIAEHNIFLGLNIPNYPTIQLREKQSGLQIGEDNPSFSPYHAWGPDKNTRTCPVCKYGRYHGIMYYVGDNPNWNDIKQWLIFLDKESERRGKLLKVYFIYGNENGYKKNARQNILEQIGEEHNLRHVALTFVPAFSDTESDVHKNKINPKAENTFIVYWNKNIVDKFINLKATEKNFKIISAVLDSTKGKYYLLPEPNRI